MKQIFGLTLDRGTLTIRQYLHSGRRKYKMYEYHLPSTSIDEGQLEEVRSYLVTGQPGAPAEVQKVRVKAQTRANRFLLSSISVKGMVQQ